MLDGEFKDMLGLVIGVDAGDGIVKLDGSSDFKIIKLEILGRIA